MKRLRVFAVAGVARGLGEKHEGGSGTVLAAGVAAAAVLVLVAVALIAGAAHTKLKAGTAADLAALAAADAARGLHEGEPCEVAARVASANGGVLIACELEQPDFDTVRVEVETTAPPVLSAFLGKAATARAQARAGPPPS